MIIRSLNVGRPVTCDYEGKPVETAFFKYPAERPVMLRSLGFEGDAQADLVHHGGPEKAVLLYAFEHYAYWERELGRHAGPAALGENLTVEGFTEEQVCIGDVYAMGGAVVQVCQPRVPCYKTAIRNGVPDMVERILACGYTGIYARVLQEGPVASGDRLHLVRRPTEALTVAQLNHLRYQDKENLAAMQSALQAEGLAQVWQQFLRKRLGLGED